MRMFWGLVQQDLGLLSICVKQGFIAGVQQYLFLMKKVSRLQSQNSKQSQEPRQWTQFQDETLKGIIQSGQPPKWAYVVKVLEERHGIVGRTPKECEERWVNDLEPTLGSEDKDKWTDAEEKLMFKYHGEFGNKWAKIAQKLNGKTDNDVKNYFYCTLRRGFKKMNKFITQKKFKGAHKEIKMAVLSKCISVAQDKFEKKIGVSSQIIEMCEAIKRKLVEVAKESFKESENQFKVFEVANDFMVFNKSHRKKKKAKSNAKDKSKKEKKGKGQKEPEGEEEESEEEVEKECLVLPESVEKNSSKTEQKANSANFEFLKARLTSGSMDFFGTASRAGSVDNTPKLNETEYFESEIKVTKVKKVTKMNKPPKVTKSPDIKVNSLGAPPNQLLTQSIEQLLQRNIKDYLLIPSLVVPSFQSNNPPNNHLLTTSGEILLHPNSDLLKFKEHFNIDNLLNASSENMGRQSNNHLMTELKKISSIDFDLFCKQNQK